MRSLFRSINSRRVRYLVISGQASVLYGAAHFSEDLDLWIDPAPSNVASFLRTLCSLGARVRKLTPPLTRRHLLRGHGFHFEVPEPGAPETYLDVMGQPPRVGRFAAAWRRAERMSTSWGNLPVVSIEDLVRIKATNRPADYEVITRLALIRLGRQERPSARLIRWAIGNVFRAEDLWTVVSELGPHLDRTALAGSQAAVTFHRIWKAGRRPSAAEFSRSAGALARNAQRAQDRGREYWLPRIAELRELRARGELLPEGMAVSELLGRSPD
jgi:hypothetical protein